MKALDHGLIDVMSPKIRAMQDTNQLCGCLGQNCGYGAANRITR